MKTPGGRANVRAAKENTNAVNRTKVGRAFRIVDDVGSGKRGSTFCYAAGRHWTLAEHFPRGCKCQQPFVPEITISLAAGRRG
jgi:hypothetical protein